jgi:hypothetical protein
MSKKALVPVNVLASGSQPAGRYAGDVYFNTTDVSMLVYTGSSWTAIPNGNLDGGTPTSEYGGITAMSGGTP